MPEKRSASRLGILAILALCLSGAPAPALGNGWEHWGIPLEVLLTALRGEQPDYQVAAARSLGFRREASAVPLLLDLLAALEPLAPVASAAIEALGRIGDARAVPAMAKILRHERRDELRADAAHAIGAIGEAGGATILLDALARDPAIVVRGALVDALARYPDPASRAALVKLIQGGNASLRLRAIRAIGHTGPEAAPALVEALAQASSERERSEIVEALGHAGNAVAIPILTKLAAAPSDADFKIRLAIALGALRDGSAVPVLIAFLEDPGLAVRGHAVQALGFSRDARAAEPLRRLATRLMAADTSDNSASLDLASEVLAVLTELDAPGSQAVFAQALAPRRGPRDSATGLALNEAAYELRRAAIVGLGYGRSPRAAALLADRNILGDRDFRIRAAAVRALGVLGLADTAAILRPLLADKAAEVRWETAFVLGRLKERQAAGPLKERLTDGHAEVRKQAALALGYLGAQDAEPDLRRLAERDAAHSVREAALQALAALAAAR